MDHRWSVLFALCILGVSAAPPREVRNTESESIEAKTTEAVSTGVPPEREVNVSTISTLEPTLQPEFITLTSSGAETAKPSTLLNSPNLSDAPDENADKKDESDADDDQSEDGRQPPTSPDPAPSEGTSESTSGPQENEFKSMVNKESLETYEKPLVPGDLNGKSESLKGDEAVSDTTSSDHEPSGYDSYDGTTRESEESTESGSSESERNSATFSHLRVPELVNPSTRITSSSTDQRTESTTITDVDKSETVPGTSPDRIPSEIPEYKENSEDITDTVKSEEPPLKSSETVHSRGSTEEITTFVSDEVTANSIPSTIDFEDHALGMVEEKAADIKTHMMSDGPGPVDPLPDQEQSLPPQDNELSMIYIHRDPNDKYISGKNHDLVAAVQFLHYDDKESSEQCNRLVSAHWDYATNLTEHNKQRQIAQTLEFSQYHKEAWRNATSFAWKSFNDTVLRRWFKKLSILGNSALTVEKLEKLHELEAEMEGIYSAAKICGYKSNVSNPEQTDVSSTNCNVPLDPDLTRTLAKSRDYDELLHVWKAWRNASGKPIREKYWEFIQISNEAARLNGFRDTGEMWREPYESETFAQDLQKLWGQLRPLYEHLHAYVRRKLISHYGSDKVKEGGPIPAHLLGNMWAQSWGNLMDIAEPYAGKPSIDITPTMKAKNMTALEMFQTSEEFFTSLGLKPMPEKFWNNSMILKPDDREVICHASAWDFCNGQDFRIKQCTDITMDDLVTVHHEMGHIQYYLQYAKQPNVFREGANPGFHEAIGDVLALSVATPKHLHSIGMLKEVADDPEGNLNFLMSLALDKVAFLPFGYLIDHWRWGVFGGDIKKEEMNAKWWELRLKYQGICPPVLRTEDDFDPGAKYHVPGNTPYIRYFVSSIIQFQMHKSLCDAAGHTGPLHACDIYRSQAAGQILSDVMELGSSENWSEAMKIMTGGSTDKMDAGPILEYFEPLLKYLEQQNQNETLGWKSDNPLLCP